MLASLKNSLPLHPFAFTECSPCVQMLRHTIVDTTNHTNVTKTKFQALETFSHFDAPVVETDGLLKQAKVSEF